MRTTSFQQVRDQDPYQNLLAPKAGARELFVDPSLVLSGCPSFLATDSQSRMPRYASTSAMIAWAHAGSGILATEITASRTMLGTCSLCLGRGEGEAMTMPGLITGLRATSCIVTKVWVEDHQTISDADVEHNSRVAQFTNRTSRCSSWRRLIQGHFSTKCIQASPCVRVCGIDCRHWRSLQ